MGEVMASIQPGTSVRLDAGAMAALAFPPPSDDLVVIVHKAALKAPFDRHTQVAHLANGDADWMGALGEDMLSPLPGPSTAGARATCGALLLAGSRLWDVVRPGALLQPGRAHPMSTVYDGSDLRPWVVLGETTGGDLIAAPLNDPKGNPKWWTPVIPQVCMTFAGNLKNAQVELAHLWTLPSVTATEGTVDPTGRPVVVAAMNKYFDL